MFIIELTYKKSLVEVDKFLTEHRAFLDAAYSAGIFLASGAKNPRDGGVILALGTREVLDELLQQDPFYREEIADYKITEFVPSKCCSDLQDLLGLS